MDKHPSIFLSHTFSIIVSKKRYTINTTRSLKTEHFEGARAYITGSNYDSDYRFIWK